MIVGGWGGVVGCLSGIGLMGSGYFVESEHIQSCSPY